jgi:hypothetical protein
VLAGEIAASVGRNLILEHERERPMQGPRNGGKTMAEETLVPKGAALSAMPTLGRNQAHSRGNSAAGSKEHAMNATDAVAQVTTLTLEQETNPWEAQSRRFDEAA